MSSRLRLLTVSCPRISELFPADQWTPLEVAVSAASWLQEFNVHRVIDIGSGPGKFCIAAALAGRCELVGLEQNPRFVAVARSLARLFGVQNRVRFLHGALGDEVLPRLMLTISTILSPNTCLPPAMISAGGASPNYERYRRDVMTAQDVFRRAPAGTIVLTYNGFGGLMPASYEACRVNRDLPCVLRLWRKSAPGRPADFPLPTPTDIDTRAPDS
jgi:SAM-dependent methyltransferase